MIRPSDATNAELSTLAPQPIPELDQAGQHVLEDFAMFWRSEPNSDAKRQCLSLVFDGIWLDDHCVVAVQPKPASSASSTGSTKRANSQRG